MGKRLDLHELFKELLGSSNVYFQPPGKEDMDYPCIRYSLNDINAEFANDKPYSHQMQYSVIVIDEDPDSEIRDKISGLPRCKFERSYAVDNLNHYVFNLIY